MRDSYTPPNGDMFIDACELIPGDLYVDDLTKLFKMIVARKNDDNVCIIHQSGRITDNLTAIVAGKKVNQ